MEAQTHNTDDKKKYIYPLNAVNDRYSEQAERPLTFYVGSSKVLPFLDVN